MNTSIDLNKLYELIDLYKYASVAGERVELIVTPLGVDGKWDDSKRVITIGLQGGFSRERDTFIVSNPKEFDEIVLPQILAYYSSDDSLGKWDIVKPDVSDIDVTAKATAETENGNLVYLESLNDNLFEEVSEKMEKVSDETTYKKDEEKDEYKIWDEIILYAKNRRLVKDFFNGPSYTEEESQTIYGFIVRLTSEKAINIGNSKKSKENNENFMIELFKDREKLVELGLTDEIVEKMLNTSDIKKLGHLAGNEKRIRRKLDLSNPDIMSRIEFATKELDRVNYYDLKNASSVQFESGKFVSSQPKTVMELKEKMVEEQKEEYVKYCDELMDYLEYKANKNHKVVETKVETPVIEFEKYDDAVVDSYEKLREAIDLVRFSKLDDEKYEIVVEPDELDENQRRVRISLLNGPSRDDTFNFLFTDGEKFDSYFSQMLEEIRVEDPNFRSEIVFNKMPGVGFVRTSLHESKEGNEVLIKKPNDNLAYPHSTKPVEEKKDEPSPDDDFMAKLARLEQQINDEVRRQDEEREKNEKPIIDTTVPFEKLHEYVATYQIANTKGPLQVFYRDSGREYIPESEEEKRNIEFAIYWSVAAGIEESRDDVVVGEKYAFNEESKKLFDIFDIQFRESVKRGIDVDLESLREQFISSEVKNADKVFERLFKNQFYVDYVKNYYQKSLGIEKEKEEKTSFELHSEFGINMSEMEKEAKEQAAELQQKNDLADIINGAKEQAKELKYRNDNLEIINGAIEQAREIQQKNDLEEIMDSAPAQAKEIQEKVERAELIDAAIEQARELQKKNERAELVEGAKEQATEIQQKNDLAEIMDSAPVQAREIQQKNEQVELINGAEEQAKLLLKLRDELFEIIEHQEEKTTSPEITEIKDAYDTVEEYASVEQPTSVKVFFDKENPGNAEVIISNGVGVDETVMYQRTFDEERLSNEIIPALCELYAKDNIVTYKQAFDVPNTDKAGLVVVGTLEKTFQVSNAPKRIVKLAEETLNDCLSKNNEEKISEKKVS